MALVIGMTVGCVGGAFLSKILTCIGKMDESQFVDFTVKCGAAVTAITVFSSLIKALKGLG